ncbi:YrdB family protein [uncultured Draconibacterium sp.]|uniref:YrdB family protein n=1 Tax=uncultured Draconibacterium sp. TaxID=1573823 RepID=UPI0029C7E533|nr:YrdB family protein [uncultured Draconibacterium sp.]
MSSNPINLVVRFLLEISSLVVIGIWGWKQCENWERYVLAIGLPVFAAALWGTFAVANDPSRSGNAPIPVPEIVRLGIEFLVFGFAAWTLYNMKSNRLSLVFVVLVLVHYVISYDRIFWLLKK